MNYRHQFHAGNFADVCKHLALMQLLLALQRKERGLLYVDTHAGRGEYDLTLAHQGLSLARRPEWPEGIGRLWGRNDLPAPVAEFVALVQTFNQQRDHWAATPRFYPGSPRLVERLARPQDRLTLCERLPEDALALRELFPKGSGVGVQQADGYAALRGQLPPPEKRALVLIDPPFEAADEFRQMTAAVTAALERMPSATLALWYPLTERARVDEFCDALLELRLPPAFAWEVSVAGPDGPLRLRGCGLVIINPPWQCDRVLTPLGGWLADTLAQAPGGGARLHWLVPE